jgi:predicted nucleic acid-binding protein
MAKAYLLDSSALIALLDKEPGAERVKELIEGIALGENDLHACFVSLTEVQYINTYDHGLADARQTIADMKLLPISWLHSDDALCASAAEWKANHKLSFADAFVIAAAARLGAVLVHKDPEFLPFSGQVKLEALPLKSGTPTSS